ncbi:peroxiredoxin-like 2C isoform X3 [Prionailurus iriomotensis]
MADLALAPVTRQVSGRAAPAAVPSGPERGQPLAATVAELSVLDASGRQVPFGALFRERRVIVVFVRTFPVLHLQGIRRRSGQNPQEFLTSKFPESEQQCALPQVDLVKVTCHLLRSEEANVTLIVIGQSSYHHIEPFCKLTGYSHEIYVDPEREIYKKLGMKRGEEIAPSGKRDPAQQGGTLILGPGNNIHFIHRDRNRLDHKPINSVLQLVGVQHVDFTSRSSVIHV